MAKMTTEEYLQTLTPEQRANREASLKRAAEIEAEVAKLNLPKRARKRLHGVEVLEVTGHPADPDAYPVEKPYPLQNELENVVTESVRKNADGQWEIHLMNYGEETSLELPSGEKLHLPARRYIIHSS